jgi:cobalt/nickel transport system permease protein
MIEELFAIEKDAYKDSVIHRLDARLKIFLVFAVIIALVAFPFIRAVYWLIGCFFLLFLVLWVASRLPLPAYVRRLAVILPLWLAVIFFQCFFENRFYPVFHPIVDLPLGIHIYAESVEFASFLLVKFVVSVSFIILLSSTTKMQDMLEGAGRFGLPPEFGLALGMMVRYLFVFGYMYRKINQAMETKCFDPFDRSLPYRYRLRQMGYTIGTLFIRSYEQGERTYTSMLCRGYGRDSHSYLTKKRLKHMEWVFFGLTLILVVGITLLVYIVS